MKRKQTDSLADPYEKKLKILRIADDLLTVGFPGSIRGEYSISIHRQKTIERVT